MCNMMLGKKYNLDVLTHPNQYVKSLTQDAISILHMVGINYGIGIRLNVFPHLRTLIVLPLCEYEEGMCLWI